MISAIDILELQKDLQDKYYIHIKPIAEDPPVNLPKFRKISRKYNSAKIIGVNRNGNTTDITDWFTVPNKNVVAVIDNWSHEQVSILYSNLSENKKEELLGSVRLGYTFETPIKYADGYST